MLLEAAVLGILIGWLKGGQLRNLSNLQIRLVLLAVMAYLLQFGLDYAGRLEMDFITGQVMPLHLLSYLLMGVFIFANLRLPGMWVMGAGIFLNFVVIAANGGVMPVSAASLSPELAKLLTSGEPVLHTYMTEGANLAYLADILPTPLFPGGKISIGDVILSLGVVLFLQQGMQDRRNYKLSFFRNRI